MTITVTSHSVYDDKPLYSHEVNSHYKVRSHFYSHRADVYLYIFWYL